MEANEVWKKLNEIGEVEDATDMIEENYQDRIAYSFFVYLPEFSYVEDSCVNVRIEKSGDVVVDTSDMSMNFRTDGEVKKLERIVARTNLEYNVIKQADSFSVSLQMRCMDPITMLLAITEIRWVNLKKIIEIGGEP